MKRERNTGMYVCMYFFDRMYVCIYVCVFHVFLVVFTLTCQLFTANENIVFSVMMFCQLKIYSSKQFPD